MMIENWARPAEQVLLAAAECKARTLGIVSPEAGSGVSALAHCIAESSAREGAKTILLDLSQRVLTDAKGGWSIGDGPTQIIRPLPEKYDLLDVRPTIETRSAFNNYEALRQFLTEELSSYDKVIVDLPAVLNQHADFVNPVGAARSCDIVMLLCVAGRISSGRLDKAMSALEVGGVKLGGLVLNDETNPTLGEQMAHSAAKSFWLPRRLKGWIKRRTRSADLLNLRD